MEHNYRQAFTDAIERASESMPDIPILLLASAALPRGDGEELDYPCAVGGRNLHSIEGDPEDLIAPIIRSSFELCLELCQRDKGDAKAMFARSVERAFGLTISSTEVERLDKRDEEEETKSDETILRDAFLRKLRGPQA